MEMKTKTDPFFLSSLLDAILATQSINSFGHTDNPRPKIPLQNRWSRKGMNSFFPIF
jgi:hypothetical protein